MRAFDDPSLKALRPTLSCGDPLSELGYRGNLTGHSNPEQGGAPGRE